MKEEYVFVLIILCLITAIVFIITCYVCAVNIFTIKKLKQKSIGKYKQPFRVGRKQKRAILDANGIEVVIFSKGSEDLAELTCHLLNKI